MFQDWFANLSPKYTPFRTEWIIYDEDLKIAGTIDMLFKIKEKRVAIFDWKCSKEIKFKNSERAKFPLAHIDDCNFSHYSLQLNLYKFLLEKNYDLIVEEMNLVVIHRVNEAARVIPVKEMQHEIKKMLQHK
jgi:ATP-dependent exoDNAse (exonuclease V) beta subunit